jgi:hypothetical protein
MLLDRLVLYAKQERCFGKSVLPKIKKPIYYHQEIVGFYAPLIRRDVECIGFLYIAREYRRKGIAYNFVEEWFKEHPQSNFYAINVNSIGLALKIGLIQQSVDGNGHPVFTTKEHKHLLHEIQE